MPRRIEASIVAESWRVGPITNQSLDQAPDQGSAGIAGQVVTISVSPRSDARGNSLVKAVPIYGKPA
jgi:hypothetical protein